MRVDQRHHPVPIEWVPTPALLTDSVDVSVNIAGRTVPLSHGVLVPPVSERRIGVQPVGCVTVHTVAGRCEHEPWKRRSALRGAHACVVAVPTEKETLKIIPSPRFPGLLFSELLEKPNAFPDGRPADIIHAWTPREVVRKFVLAYQRLIDRPARVLVHLEDNEEFLLERFARKSLAELRKDIAAAAKK